MSDTSAFKKLYSAMINNGGDLSKVQSEFKDASGKVKKIKCFVKESFPHFLVTDNYFFIPCYFTKKAVDEFKSKNSGINIVDLKSKVVEIGDWCLEMMRCDSSSCFTSYAGIEIRLIVRSFKLVQGSKEKVLLTRYPVNLYRDDEMKTLFQNYHHGQLSTAVRSGCKNDSLPDVTKKGDSIVKFTSKLQYSFKSDKPCACVDMVSIFKSEKGAAAFQKLTDGTSSQGRPKVISKVAAGKAPKASKAKKINIASKLIKKTPRDGKISMARLKTGKTPTLKTPTGTGASATQTPKPDQKNFKKMMNFLKQQRKNK